MDSAGTALRASDSDLIERQALSGRWAAGHDERPLSAVGRRARIHLNFLHRRGRTVLADAYSEPPFRIGRSFAEGDGLHMIVASTAPGMFGGDYLQQIVRVGSGARVRLTSQSALQIHPSPDSGVACLQSSYCVEDGARLSCEWHPLIPFAGARIEQHIEISISGGGCVNWSDAFMSGREASGEKWKFASLAHEIAVARDGFLEYLERYRIEPGDVSLLQPWAARDASYLGTALMTGQPIGPGVAEQVHFALGRFDGVLAACDQLGPRAMLVRLLSAAGPAFHEARRWICDHWKTLGA